ncbi:NIPSNAP family protein [Hydrogenophaga sp. BPS33]|uniref:NIPSNAP family protein n=1 Tax=Hydrogenophaga sp. BPS33 TaxID=2651974 RepID=UPI0019177D91|nr:NIPSNAP family protein [Hydrogenophaga sp. BPS33]
MIFELRTYTAKPGRTADFLKLYEDEALALQQKHLGGLVGFYVTELGPLNQIVHLWRYASLADREQRRQTLEADPAWAVYRAHYRELDAIQMQDSKILKPASFSPV